MAIDTEVRRTGRGAVLALMCVGMFVVQLDVTVVNVALPSIGADFGLDTSALQWVVSGYSVAFAAFLLVAGSAGDVHGHRRVVLVGFALFAIASIGCAMAPGVNLLVLARIVQGIGAAVLLPGTLALITLEYPDPAEQSRVLGIWAGTAALALPSGPLVGGALVDVFGWRAVFWINVPVLVAAFVATRLIAPETPTGPSRRLDIPGSVCAATFLGSTVYCVIEVGSDGFAPQVAGGGVLAVAALAAFVAVERRSAQPMFPLGLLRSRRFVGANVVAMTMNFVGIGMIFLLGLYLQQERHLTPLHAGLAQLPLFLPLAVLAPITGRLTARYGPRSPAVAGLIVGAAGSVVIATVDQGDSLILPMTGMLLLGCGMGLLTASIVSAAMRAVPAQMSGVGSGVNNTARQAGGAMGVACLGAAALPVAGTVCAVLWLAGAIVVIATVDRP